MVRVQEENNNLDFQMIRFCIVKKITTSIPEIEVCLCGNTECDQLCLRSVENRRNSRKRAPLAGHSWILGPSTVPRVSVRAGCRPGLQHTGPGLLKVCIQGPPPHTSFLVHWFLNFHCLMSLIFASFILPVPRIHLFDRLFSKESVFGFHDSDVLSGLLS